MNKMGIQSLHDGLTQMTTYNYEVDDSRRVGGNTFSRIVALTLPLFLTMDVWKRHNYSVSDIKSTLEYFSAVHLWQCALLHGVSPSNSAIKLAFSTPESMVYGSKAIVIRKIEKILIQQHNFPEKGSVLDTLREDHIPPIPIHCLATTAFNKCSSLLPTKPVNLLSELTFDCYFQWKDIYMVPLWIEKDALYMIRIIPKKVFLESGRLKNNSLSNQPVKILIQGEEYCGVEESCFFMPK
jgi:hypothetical protein